MASAGGRALVFLVTAGAVVTEIPSFANNSALENLLQDNGVTAERMMGALLRGVSTRQYEEVLPEMAETVGVSRSSISRQAIEGSAEQLRQLRERRWDHTDVSGSSTALYGPEPDVRRGQDSRQVSSYAGVIQRADARDVWQCGTIHRGTRRMARHHNAYTLR